MAAWVLTEMLDLPALRHRRSTWNVSRSLRSIFQHRDRLALFAKAMLMAAAKRVGKPAAKALIPALRRDLDNAAVQTAAAAHFAEATSEELRLLLHSSSRTDAIVLASYVEVAPQDPLIPKIVRGLMDARIKGRWETTQANAFAMYALGRYFQRYERQLPNYEAQVWLGSKYVGSKRFVGRSMSVSEKEIPMWALLEETRRRGGRTELILARRGTGRLYYRIGLRYAPASLKLPPEEQGFAVSRVYEPVADPRSVTRDAKGIWHVKAGSYVRVRLTVVVPDRRYYVAVVDPLPAGFEIVDLDLKTSASTSLASALQRPRNKIFDFWFWYPVSTPDHREIRDDSYQLFWDRLPAGVYEYTYLARATTLGTFVVPPLKAEEMYHPETFGRSATNIVVVEP